MISQRKSAVVVAFESIFWNVVTYECVELLFKTLDLSIIILTCFVQLSKQLFGEVYVEIKLN